MSFKEDIPDFKSIPDGDLYMQTVPDDAWTPLESLIRKAADNSHKLRAIINNIAEITGGQITRNWGWDFLENDITDCVRGIQTKVNGNRVEHFEAFMDCLAILHDVGSLTYDDINEFLEDHGIGYQCEAGLSGKLHWDTATDVEIKEDDDNVDDNTIAIKIEEEESVENMINTNISKPHKLFISHSSNDKAYMVALVEMLEDIGMPDGSFVCTSVPGHGIPGGARIYDWLRNQFLTCDLRVLFALSHNYYKSAVCLNEMGAAWVTKATDTILLLPGFGFSDVDGCIDSTEMGISFGMDDEELKHRLNEFKDSLIEEHQLPSITQTRWERHRNKFIKKVREIAAEKNAEEGNETTEVVEKAARGNSNTDPFDFPPIQLHASVMLFFAAENDKGEIIVSTTLRGTNYVSGRYPLNSSVDALELAKWNAAIKELIRAGYIEQVSLNKTNQIYKVTDKGYAISDRFGNDNQLDASMTPSEVIAMFEDGVKNEADNHKCDTPIIAENSGAPWEAPEENTGATWEVQTN